MVKNTLISFDRPYENQVLITGIVRNIASTFDKDFFRLSHAFSSFASVKWFLVESDSTDESIEILETFSERHPNFEWCSLGKLDKSDLLRTERLAIARNRYVREVKKKEYSDVSVIAVADFNSLSNLIDEKAILSCWNRKGWAACTANQNGRYYDIWALRHPLWSPSDCWKQLEFLKKYSRFPEAALYVAVNSKMITIPQTEDWIEVDSAFGGLALYDSKFFKFSHYSGLDKLGNETCEHVHFNQIIRENGGSIFINPRMINTTKTDHSSRASFPHSLYRILKYPIKLLKKVKS
jgi:glycosyltransferase involved in cell wall biosynthesis